jgi:hypothetical protein
MADALLEGGSDMESEAGSVNSSVTVAPSWAGTEKTGGSHNHTHAGRRQKRMRRKCQQDGWMADWRARGGLGQEFEVVARSKRTGVEQTGMAW